MLNLVNQSTKETFQLPQSINEIGFDYVQKCASHINVSKHYAVVALLTTAPLVDLIDTNSVKTGNTKAIVVKANYADDADQHPLNRFIFCAPSDLFNGIDCNTYKNELSISNIRRFIANDKDLSMSIKRGTIFGKVGQTAAASVISSLSVTDTTPKLDITIIKTVCCLDFKIIRITDIVATNVEDGLPETGKISKYIVASNLLAI